MCKITFDVQDDCVQTVLCGEKCVQNNILCGENWGCFIYGCVIILILKMFYI